MNITITNRNKLLKVLNQCYRIVRPRNVIPILECFKIEANNNELVISSSNDESTLSYKFTTEYADNGSFCVSAKDFRDAVNLLSTDTFKLTINEKSQTMIIQHSKGKMRLPIMSANEFPIKDDIKYDTQFEIDSQLLFEVIEEAKSFCDTDPLRPVLEGMNMYIKDGIIGFSSTDQFSIYWRTLPTDITENIEFITDKRVLSIVQEVINSQQTCIVNVGDNNIKYSTNESSLILRRIVGRFPNVPSVCKKEQPIICKVNKIEFIDGVKRSAFGSDILNKLISLNIRGNEIDIDGEDIQLAKKVRETIPCECDNNIRIRLQYERLLNVLNNIQTDKVEIRLTSSDTPIVLMNDGDESALMMLMTFQLNN